LDAEWADIRSRSSPVSVRPGARTEEALVIYRFTPTFTTPTRPRLAEDVKALPGRGGPAAAVRDSAGIGDVDFTAGSVLLGVIERLHQRHVRFVITSRLGPVRHQFGRYDTRGVKGSNAYYDAPGEALEALPRRQPALALAMPRRAA
jgi:SulP family sulfate permease